MKWSISTFGVVLLASLTLTRPAAAETQFSPAQRAEIVQIIRDALKTDPSILREATQALRADNEARQAEASRAAIAAHRAHLVSPSDPVAGNPQGDVTIVEFFDTRCPFCRRLEPAMDALLGQDHGIRLVYKDLPILGPASVLGSKALLAAQAQGGYERLRAALMQLPPDTTESMVQVAAERAGLDWTRLKRDMADPAVQRRIDANLQLAEALKIEGTPALVVGGDMVSGAVGLAELRKIVAGARAAGG
jgi:protein-disulfide isomerase